MGMVESGKMNEITKRFGGVCLFDEPMSAHTSMKVGGGAEFYIEPADEQGFVDTIKFLKKQNTPFFVFGKGTNMIVRDGGVSGAVLSTPESLKGIKIEPYEAHYNSAGGATVYVGAGVSLTSVAAKAAEAGFSGLEALSGIPGTVGGALFMNAGAYGGEISQVVVRAKVYDAKADKIRLMDKEEMNLSYRGSIFQHNENLVILAVSFNLTERDKNEIRKDMREYMRRRNEKQPVELPSAGSFFKRPYSAYAGALIERAGMKGAKSGGAQVSGKHAGFIVNTGGATAEDILSLAEEVRRKVNENSGILLDIEPRIIGNLEKRATVKLHEDPPAWLPENLATRLPENPPVRPTENPPARLSDELPVRPAENNAGKVAEPSRRASPRAGKTYYVISDMHTHTQYSHGRGMIEHNILAARAIGLTRIGITDHGPAHVAFGVTRSRIPDMREEINLMKERYDDIEILLGIEANITNPDGILDIHEEDAEMFDYVIAGYHYGSVGKNPFASIAGNIVNFITPPHRASDKMIESNTQNVIAALRKNDIYALTHPGDKAPVDLMEVARVCAETDTLVELNTHHRSLTAQDIQGMIKVADVEFLISSDAHSPGRVGDFASAIELVIESGMDRERVVNLRWK